MLRFSWLFAVGFIGLGSAVACGGPDVSVVENGDAGKGGTETSSGGTMSESGGSQTKAGASATGGGSGGTTSASGGAMASGGHTNTGGKVGMGGASGGTDTTGGMIGAGGDSTAGGDSGLGGSNTGGCQGQAPLCFGSNVQHCCGNDPAGTATCQNGKWSCFGAAAPGCNGTRCVDEFSCGTQLTCDRSKTFCVMKPISAGSAEYSCAPLPDACANVQASCDCVKPAGCTKCTNDFGAVTETCPNGL